MPEKTTKPRVRDTDRTVARLKEAATDQLISNGFSPRPRERRPLQTSTTLQPVERSSSTTPRKL